MLLLPWLWGCASSRVVRLEPAPQREPVVVSQREFVDTILRLSLDGRFALRPEAEDVGQVRWASWQPAHTIPSAVAWLDAKERRNVALSYALDTVWEGVEAAVKATVNPVALKGMVSAALCAYMVLLVAPEPVTKFVAIALAAYLVAYVGMGPLWNMVEGFRRLRDESEKATSFATLEEIGHRFGRVMGDNGARVAILVVLAAAGGRAGLAKNGPTLPGYAQAAMAAETQAGFQLAAVAAGELQSISISAGALTVGLAPTAVASIALSGAGSAGGGDPEHASTRRIKDLLKPHERWIGKAGSSANVRELTGGLLEAQKLFDELAVGGTQVLETSYPGTLVRLPGGGTVGLRTMSKSGPPTIDINIPGFLPMKLKFLP